MNIAVIAPGLWHAPEVVEAARELGHRAVVVGAGERHSGLRTPVRAARAIATRVPGLAAPTHAGLGLGAALSLRPTPDLIVGWSSFALASELVRHGCPILLVRGSHHIRRQRLMLSDLPERERPGRAMIWLEEREYALAPTITVPTQAIADDPLWLLQGSRAPFVAPYGFPPVRLPPPRQTNGRISVVFGGAFSYRKGADRLVAALRNRPGVVSSFSIYGKPQTGLANVPDWWSFRGLQSRPAWIEGLERSDALILPSREEGTARVGLEAIACGVPVVATPEAGLTRWLKQGAGIEIEGQSWTLSLEPALEGIAANRDAYRERCHEIATSWSWQDHVECLLANSF